MFNLFLIVRFYQWIKLMIIFFLWMLLMKDAIMMIGKFKLRDNNGVIIKIWLIKAKIHNIVVIIKAVVKKMRFLKVVKMIEIIKIIKNFRNKI